MASASETPLSGLLAAHAASGKQREWVRFLDAFRVSQLGVKASGLPESAAGTIVATADRPLSVALTGHAGGRPMVLAFADPAAFERRFGRRFNVTVTGDALLAIALHNPECDGVLVNSALTETCTVIERATAESLLRAGRRGSAAKPWWRFR